MSKTGFKILKILDLIRNEFPNTQFTLNDVVMIYMDYENILLDDPANQKQESEKKTPDYEQQVRRRLKDLQEWGYIEGEYDKYDNNKLVYRLTDSSDESTQDQVIKTLLSELVRTMTMYVDEKPDALQATQDQLNRGVNLNEFLTVSGENEFPLIYGQDLNRIQLLHENFNDKRFSLVEEEKGQSYPLFVFQVRLLSQGFFLAGLKPDGEVGASLKWIYLCDLHDIKSGDTFTMPKEQIDFIKSHLVVLSNQELAQLQE